MSKHERDVRLSELPKPVTLTPDQAQQVAAGAAAALPSAKGSPAPIGPPSPPRLPR
jgi:hypothetical protein